VRYHGRMPADAARPSVGPSAAPQEDPEAVIELLQEWLADESGYDESTWPELKAALDQDRLSARKLFDE
jgi:hypothetical protein